MLLAASNRHKGDCRSGLWRVPSGTCSVSIKMQQLRERLLLFSWPILHSSNGSIYRAEPYNL